MKNILICDDSVFMRMMIKNALKENEEYTFLEAENGKQAVEIYKNKSPDVVILDITMPIMDGLEALKKIREDEPDARIIMCSAMGQKEMVMDTISNGAMDFVIKPFDNSKLIESVKLALEQ